MTVMGKKKKKRIAGQSQLGLIIFRFKKNKLACLGVVCLLLIALIVLTAPLYLSYDKAIKQDIPVKFQSPNPEHPFGTDLFGRDLLARVVYGGRISLFAGLAVILLSLMVGVVFGGVAGYFGGRVDQLLMRFMDIFMAIPYMLLVLAIVTALGEGTRNMIIALMVSNVPGYARIIRSSIMTLRNQEFVEAAKCFGTSNYRIITKHILPNGIGPVIVTATITLGSTILAISSLGFLGVGISPPTPEWGSLLADNRFYIRYHPYLGLIPGFAIMVTVMCVNFIGDGLRDALDPKMKK
ncbi:peptide ABC transporter permease [Spirochaetia bacterium]|nr:peptide ABC transporter permease [Spirochaetia bacterium]